MSRFLANSLNPVTDASASLDDVVQSSGDAMVTLDDSDPTFGKTPSDAVLQVTYEVDDPYSNYTEAYFSVQRADTGDKFFYGWLRTPDGRLVLVLDILLEPGMTLLDLSDLINNIPGCRAIVLKNQQNSFASLLLKSGVFDGTNRWAYFFFPEDQLDGSTDDSDDLRSAIHYYMTSAIPFIANNNGAQSIGGYVSRFRVSGQSVLEEEIGFDDKFVSLIDDSLRSYEYLQIQDEIVKVSSWQGRKVFLSERNAFGTPLRVHYAGATVKGLLSNQVFNQAFSSDRKQYRCIAIRNESLISTAKNVKIYFKTPSRNSKTKWRIAIEIPRSDAYAGSATSGTENSFTDSNLASLLFDDYFKTAPVFFTSGQNNGQSRIVTSYSSDGTFAFDEPLPYPVSVNDTFYIDTAPAQRISNGLVAPRLQSSGRDDAKAPYLISEFQSADGFTQGRSINIEGFRSDPLRSSNDLAPRQAVYVWIERSLEPSNSGQENNRFDLTLEYTKG